MATNKNATIRYLTLDRCFSNSGRKYNIEDLVEACNEALLDIDPDSSGIKKRQVYEDIKFMKDSKGFDAPIESHKEGRIAYYRYENPKFSIGNQPINDQEIQQMRETLTTLSRFQGLPQFEWIEDMKARLEQSSNKHVSEKVISFDENKYLTGREYLSKLHNAIINKIVIEIDYQSFKSDLKNLFVIHPYYLKQYNNRWFLFGLNEEKNLISNIPLDRICSIRQSRIKYRPNTTIDFDEYFEDVIGVSILTGESPLKILLKISTKQWPYIKTKPIHGSQKVKEENMDFAVIELSVIPNFELESTLLSFGEDVEVLEPLSLKEKLTNRIKTMLVNYSAQSNH